LKPAEDYILKQSDPFQSILLDLKAIIEATLPEAELHFKWRLPFYYFEGRPLCYLNQSKDYVDFCFWHSHIMEKHQNKFVTKNRKAVVSLRYKSQNEIDDKILIYVLKKLSAYKVNAFKRN
jgi:hypothetical protein